MYVVVLLLDGDVKDEKAGQAGLLFSFIVVMLPRIRTLLFSAASLSSTLLLLFLLPAAYGSFFGVVGSGGNGSFVVLNTSVFFRSKLPVL